MAIAELEAEELRRTADPAQFRFQSTADLEPALEIIGQPRAMEAVDFGVSISSPGYNMFALGPAGTGRTTAVMRYLEREAAGRPVPDDWCYVNNFREPHRPHALRLPPGKGAQLRSDMDNVVNELKTEIPRAFESEEYARQKEEINRQLGEERQHELSQLERAAAEQGLSLVRTPAGISIVPLREGKPLSPEEFAALPAPTRDELQRRSQDVQVALNAALRLIRRLERAARDRIQRLDRELASFAVAPIFDELREAYADYPAVVQYLSAAQRDIIENLDIFRQAQSPPQPTPELPAPLARMVEAAQAPSFDRYRVNVLVDNAQTRGAPLIREPNPTFPNLVGRIEHQAQFGALVTNFTLIKPGALLRANGGYLVLDARDVLANPYAWEALKRALKTSCLRVEEMAQEYRFVATASLDPEPIPLEIKVALIGDAVTYYLLRTYDEDFAELFKVKVDFAVVMDWTPENAELYARLIAGVCREEHLRPFAPSGVARIIEQSARMAGDQLKLSARFGEVLDLVREASFWAGRSGHEQVVAEDVRRALETRIYRSNQVEERIREMIARGVIHIDASGEAVGQVNGLSVLSLGDYEFGRPSRITARIFPGHQGVVDIQRQTKMGGPIHSKGVLILSGYLGGKYATDRPLTLSASIAFEQLYEGVEGDSASSAELYALLSSLSGLPLRQGLAVTGSVDQHGMVQAIAGVNEKIEGYFQVCRVLGLTGRQGVLIPADNTQHLMLQGDVIEAVRQGRFHIFAVRTIDEGIEILTGRPAGERRPDGRYPEGSVNAAMEARLRALAEAVRDFGPGAEERTAIEPEKAPEPIRFGAANLPRGRP